MVGQQDVAGARCKVLQLRAELDEIQMARYLHGTDRWTAAREGRDATLRALKEAEHAARNASKQRAEDDLRRAMREREEKRKGVAGFRALA